MGRGRRVRAVEGKGGNGHFRVWCVRTPSLRPASGAGSSSTNLRARSKPLWALLRVNQAGPSPWPWSPGSGRGRQTHLLGAPALRFSEDPGLCVHSLAPRKRQRPQKPPAGLAGPSTGTCRGGGGVPERYLPCAPQISFPPHFVDGKRLKFYFI